MIKLKKTLFLFTFLLSVNSALAEIPAYQYKVRIPVTSLSCEQEAAKLAERFFSSTQIPGAVSSCQGIINATFDGVNVHLYSLQIDYKAKGHPKLYSASLGGIMDSMSRSIESGAFATYADCLNQIHDQSQNFERETGLIALSASCSPVEILDGYKMQIEGFGKAKRELEIFHLDFGADEADLKQEILKFMVGHGANIVRSVGDAVLYYAENQIGISQQYFGSFHQSSDCASQIEAATMIFKSAGSKSAPIVRCLKNANTFGQYNLSGLSDGYDFFSQEELPMKYYSFSECFEDRARELKLHPDANGAICGENLFTNSEFIMSIYSEIP